MEHQSDISELNESSLTPRYRLKNPDLLKVKAGLVGVLQIKTPRAFVPLLPPRRYKGARGGRGSGKSHFFVESGLEKCIMEPHTRIVCIREIQKSLERSVKQLIEDKIQKLNIQSYFNVQNDKIITPGDGVISFEGMQNHTAETIKSLEAYDVAFVEEAQALSQRSLTLLTPTIRNPGSELWFAWNRRSPKDPVDKFFRDNAGDPDFVDVQVNYVDNPWFPEELKRDMERDKRRDPDKYAHVWLGGYQQHSEARIFKNISVEEFDTPPNARFLHGADWGFASDPTVQIRAFEKDDCLYIDHEVYLVGCRIEHIPFLFGGFDDEKLKALNMEGYNSGKILSWATKHKGIPGSYNWPCIADSSRPETIDFMRRHGYPNIRGAIKGPGSIDEGIEFLKDYDTIYIHPRCPHTIDEFATYAYKIDRLTEEVLPIIADDHNHVIDSCRYAVEGLRRQAPEALTGTFEMRR